MYAFQKLDSDEIYFAYVAYLIVNVTKLKLLLKFFSFSN